MPPAISLFVVAALEHLCWLQIKTEYKELDHATTSDEHTNQGKALDYVDIMIYVVIRSALFSCGILLSCKSCLQHLFFATHWNQILNTQEVFFKPKNKVVFLGKWKILMGE